MKNIRLVVTDLDGTLLDPQKNITPALQPVLGQLRQLGVGFTFVTGRPFYAVQRFAQAVGLAAPVVTCNGAVLCNAEGDVLSHRSFPLAPLQAVMEKAVVAGLTVLVYTGGVEYALAPTQWTREREAQGRGLPIKTFSAQEWQTGTAEKVNIMADGKQGDFNALRGDILGLDAACTVTLYGDAGCEIVAHGVDKALGLRNLCALLQVPPEQTLALGDNANDVEMLQAAGIGAAVANATPEVKQCADYVCSASYTDGVIEAIRHFVLQDGGMV